MKLSGSRRPRRFRGNLRVPASVFARFAESNYNSYAPKCKIRLPGTKNATGQVRSRFIPGANHYRIRVREGRNTNMARPLDLRLASEMVRGIFWLAAVICWSAIAAAQEAAEAPAEEAAKQELAADAVEPKEEGSAKEIEPAQEAGPAARELGDGRLIRVRLPLAGNADQHIKGAIERAMAQLKQSATRDPGRRPVLILELVPTRRQGSFGEGTDFERATSLARYLTSSELSSVKTVAYIPRSIKGHGVLLALACEEIVMAPEAEIGEAGVDEDDRRAVDPLVVSTYQQIAAARKTVPEAIALGMLDRRAEVLKVETDQGTDFVLRGDMAALEKDHTIVSQEVLVPLGSLGNFNGRQGREYGFVKLFAKNEGELARGLGLPPEDVIEDQSLVGDWRPVMVDLTGPITPRTVRQLQSLIGNEIDDHNVNWICLRIDSAGGDLENCLQLAETLAALDSNEVRTVAYVPVEATGGAGLIALACDQLVMQPDAKVGGKGSIEFDPSTIEAGTIAIRESLAGETDQSWSLLAATIDPKLEVFAYRNRNTGDVRYFSKDEVAEQEDPKAWQREAKITTDGEPLRLSSQQAAELGVAWHVVESLDELNQLYGFEHDPRVAVPNWALELVEALSSPALRCF